MQAEAEFENLLNEFPGPIITQARETVDATEIPPIALFPQPRPSGTDPVRNRDTRQYNQAVFILFCQKLYSSSSTAITLTGYSLTPMLLNALGKVIQKSCNEPASITITLQDCVFPPISEDNQKIDIAPLAQWIHSKNVKALHCRGHNFDDVAIHSLGTALSTRALDRLELSASLNGDVLSPFTMSNIPILASGLTSSIGGVNTLILNNFSLPENLIQIADLLKKLKSNDRIQTLDLSRTTISLSLASSIVTLLEHSHLNTLILNGCIFTETATDSAFSLLRNGIAKSKHLTTLSLQACTLTPQDIKALMTSITESSVPLEALDVSQNEYQNRDELSATEQALLPKIVAKFSLMQITFTDPKATELVKNTLANITTTLINPAETEIQKYVLGGGTAGPAQIVMQYLGRAILPARTPEQIAAEQAAKAACIAAKSDRTSVSPHPLIPELLSRPLILPPIPKAPSAPKGFFIWTSAVLGMVIGMWGPSILTTLAVNAPLPLLVTLATYSGLTLGIGAFAIGIIVSLLWQRIFSKNPETETLTGFAMTEQSDVGIEGMGPRLYFRREAYTNSAFNTPEEAATVSIKSKSVLAN